MVWVIERSVPGSSEKPGNSEKSPRSAKTAGPTPKTPWRGRQAFFLEPDAPCEKPDHSCAIADLSCTIWDYTCAILILSCAIANYTCAIPDMSCAIADLSYAIADHTCAKPDLSCAIPDHTRAIADLSCANPDPTGPIPAPTRRITNPTRLISGPWARIRVSGWGFWERPYGPGDPGAGVADQSRRASWWIPLFASASPSDLPDRYALFGLLSLGVAIRTTMSKSSDRLPGGLLRDRIQTPELVSALAKVRMVADAVSRESPRVIPDFTDHTVEHMDHLFALTEKALTPDEITKLNESEAFILACSYYLHDLGMTLPVIPDVQEKLIERAGLGATGVEPSDAEFATLIRRYHPDLAKTYAVEPIPVPGKPFLFDEPVRNNYGAAIGKVSASHGSSLTRLDEDFGRDGTVPIGTSQADLGYLACVLRVVDYMDITARRAPSLVFKLRDIRDRTSIEHWKAQARVADPIRDKNYLKYSSGSPISHTDAWWLFYDLVSGLAAEIQSVAMYLANRTDSRDRFSLHGVVGSESPMSLARYIFMPDGHLPIDVRVRPASMEQVITLLGGESLYGRDKLAPLRELIQNARDAIYARAHVSEDFTVGNGMVELCLENNHLCVKDNGIGMSEEVIYEHLLGLGSSYWSSASEKEIGLDPVHQAGRFGIGFVSAFMFADEVHVETRRDDKPSLKLKLQGLDRRGTLSRGAVKTRVGTSVRLRLKPGVESLLVGRTGLFERALARAPMLPCKMRSIVEEDVQETECGWWRNASQKAIREFIGNWHTIAFSGQDDRRWGWRGVGWHSTCTATWPFDAPRVSNDAGSLAVDPEGGAVLLCSKGLAVEVRRAGGLSGLVELGEVPIDASRHDILNIGQEGVWGYLASRSAPAKVNELVVNLRGESLGALDKLSKQGQIPVYHDLFEVCYELFGATILQETSCPWIAVVAPPGNVVHMSVGQIESQCATKKAAVVAFDSGSARHAYRLSSRFKGFDAAEHDIVLWPKTQDVLRMEGNGDLREHANETVRWSLKEACDRLGAEGVECDSIGMWLITMIMQSMGMRSDQLPSCECQISFNSIGAIEAFSILLAPGK